MATVHGDPQALRDLASRIGQFARETRDNMQGLRSLLNDMGSSTWSDQRYAEYEAEFEQVASSIERSLEVMEPEHVRHLESLAARLEEYERG